MKAVNKTSVEKQPFFSVWQERFNPVSSSPRKGLSQWHPLPSCTHLPANIDAVLSLEGTIKCVQDPDVPEGLAQAGLDLPLDRLPVGVPVGWRVVRV